jgi:hypothetical protein
VEDQKLMISFKSSLMKNKHLKQLKIFYSPFIDFMGTIPNYEYLKIFLSGPWENEKLETILMRTDKSMIPHLKEFILMNTPVKELLFLNFKLFDFLFDFTDELKLNTNLVNIGNHSPIPLYYYYIERNKELETIHKKFKTPIRHVKIFDISFQFKN